MTLRILAPSLKPGKFIFKGFCGQYELSPFFLATKLEIHRLVFGQISTTFGPLTWPIIIATKNMRTGKHLYSLCSKFALP